MAAEQQTVDLVAWLTRIWDEEERLAYAATTGPWQVDGPWWWEDEPGGPRASGMVTAGLVREAVAIAPKHSGDSDLRFIAAHDPASVLARIAADRKILARCMRIWSEHEEGGPLNGLVRAVDAGLIVHDLAAPYRDRPGFPESAVERQGAEQ